MHNNMKSRLGSSVGRGGVNGSGDVKYIQALLSSWLATQKQGPLAVDGICGRLTQTAIDDFQRLSSRADGRIDPQGPTLRELELAHGSHLVAQVKNLSYLATSGQRLSREPPVFIDSSAMFWRYLDTLRQSFGPLLPAKTPAARPQAGPQV